MSNSFKTYLYLPRETKSGEEKGLISVEKWVTIRNLAREGYGKKAIARMLNVSRNTVRKALSNVEPPQYVRQVKTDTLITPITPYLAENSLFTFSF